MRASVQKCVEENSRDFLSVLRVCQAACENQHQEQKHRPQNITHRGGLQLINTQPLAHYYCWN